MDNITGTEIKGYLLKERIGAGGFGAVYRAEQSTVGRDVAVKVILPGLASRPEFIRRFENEAQLVARLEHLHITPLYDYWRDPEGAYLVMRYLRGGSLADALDGEPYTLEAAADLLDQVAAALAAAHRARVIHRDIKPSNILLDEDGNAYLTDFGIAKDLELRFDADTETGAVLGSPDYLAPEQARSDPVTSQTDIYSLGIVLYEMLAGEHPFPNLSGVERLFKHLNEPVPRMTNLDTEVIDPINAVVQKATAKDPKTRYADALAFANAFREAARLGASREVDSLVELLTPREQEVLKLILDGKSNREIAEALIVELVTVKWYVKQIYRKLNVRSRVQAIVRARELDLVVRPPDVPTTGSVLLPEPENPYKGLRPFQAADAADFFGRERLVKRLIGRLVEKTPAARFLAIVGPSGSGKSSLVRAGLIPALWRGELPKSDNWYIVDLVPGAHPFEELEVALTRVAAQPVGRLKEHLEDDARGLLRASQLVLPDDDSELLVVIDQFEEVFTLVEAEEVRARFLEILHTAVTDKRSRVRVVVTLRADFYDRPLRYPEFGRLVRDRVETVLPLSAEELERAIVRPAAAAGVAFEEGLPATIIQAIHYQPGALPLLQYALTELFESREGRQLTHKGYQSIGGVVGALALRAEGVYGEQDERGREMLRQMFLRLVTLGEGVEDTRRRVPRAELLAVAVEPERMDELVDTLVAYRLLSLDVDPGTREPTVEVAHEAILREWERLRGWLNEGRADIREQQNLSRLAADWEAGERHPEYLLSGSRLVQMLRWAEGTDLAQTELESRFLSQSHEAERVRIAEESARLNHEKRLEGRSQKALRALVGVFAAGVVTAVLLAGFAFNQRDLAVSERDARATQQGIAEEQAAQIATSVLEIEAQRRAAVAAGTEAANERDAAATAQAIAEEQARISAIGSLSAQALTLLDTNLDLALLLSVEAYRSAGSLVTLQAMGAAWKAYPDLVRYLHGHRSPVRSVAFSPDGKLLASGDDDGFIILWDADPTSALFGYPLAVLGEPTASTESLQFHPGQPLLASAGRDGVVRLWSTERFELLGTMTVENALLFALSISPDGQTLAASGSGGAIHLFDMNTLEERATLIGHRSTVRALAFSSDGRLLASGGDDDSIRIWNGISGETISVISGEITTVRVLAFSTDGRKLVSGHEVTNNPIYSDFQDIVMWEVESGEELASVDGHPGDINALVFSQDGGFIFSGGEDGVLYRWSADSLVLMEEMSRRTQSINSLAISPDGSFIGVAGDAPAIKIWTTERSLNHSYTELDIPVTNLLFSPVDRDLLAIQNSSQIILRDVSRDETLVTLSNPGDLNDIDFSPDGAVLAAVSSDRMIRLWNTHRKATGFGMLIAEISGSPSALIHVAYHPLGDLVATATLNGTIEIWDLVEKKILASLEQPFGDNITSLAFNQDGSMLGVSLERHDVLLFDVDYERRIFDRAPEILDLADSKTTSVIWANPELIVVDTWVGNFFWNPQENRLLTSPFEDGSGAGMNVNRSVNILASGMNDYGFIHYWDVDPESRTYLQMIGQLRGIPEVGPTSLNSDGSRLASATLSGHLQIWTMPFGWQEDNCLRAGRNLTQAEWETYIHWAPYDPGYRTCPQWPGGQ